MSLSGEAPAAVRYLVPGLAAGLVCFAFSRVLIGPLISSAVDYEGEREHAEAMLTGDGHSHGHELFTRAVQENAGAGLGIVAFAVVMGTLFAVAYTVIAGVLARRGVRPDPLALTLLLSAGLFVAVALVPALKYPANPPTVGLDETVAQRSSAFLTMLGVSVLGAVVALGLAVRVWRRGDGRRVSAWAIGGYAVVVAAAMVWLPSFHEVPGSVAGPQGPLLDGFPAEVLADFRVYTLLNQALMWTVIGVVYAVATQWWSEARRPLTVAHGRDR
ncbi:CbtA family protein [Mycobacterium sp. WMMD1722]|uniref:CbtA family protein n=1 Tax=Mycobacterium sp. WMMD1722 TaxID=3404117 RepID=UPI003BF55C24